MRSLMLLRHGQTEDARPGFPDRARRLTPDGQRQAAELGEHLRETQVAIDQVVRSPAVRVEQTVLAIGTTAPVVVVDSLYNAGSDEILDLIRGLDEGFAHVLVVGHAPGLPAVVHELADAKTSDAEALASIAGRFPAGTLATMAVTGPWRDLEQATLVSVRLP